ncbi:MAG TPA: hypothetical protein VN229_06190 [Terriglobales bacterium]|nr:hypothetical protein [Terriglobales bacterium]
MQTPTAIKTPGKPRGLGPKQMAWCDEHLGNFGTYRKGVEQVIAETEASRRAAGSDVTGAGYLISTKRRRSARRRSAAIA